MIKIMVIMWLIIQGNASQYAPGVMNRVIKLRQSWGQIPADVNQYDGFIAVADCDRIGETVFMRPYGQARWEMFLITDCASKTDARESDGLSGYRWMIENGIDAEVDYDTAARWGVVGRMVKVEIVDCIEIRIPDDLVIVTTPSPTESGCNCANSACADTHARAGRNCVK